METFHDDPWHADRDEGWGKCPNCGAYLTNAGIYSDGDGDTYEAIKCPVCKITIEQVNKRYHDGQED